MGETQCLSMGLMICGWAPGWAQNTSVFSPILPKAPFLEATLDSLVLEILCRNSKPNFIAEFVPRIPFGLYRMMFLNTQDENHRLMKKSNFIKIQLSPCSKMDSCCGYEVVVCTMVWQGSCSNTIGRKIPQFTNARSGANSEVLLVHCPCERRWNLVRDNF